MGGNNQRSSEHNKGSLFLYVLLLLGTLIALIISAVACFLPAVASTILFKTMKKRLPPPDHRHEHWVTLWATTAQTALYLGGVLTFHRIAFVNGQFLLNEIIPRMKEFSSWMPLYLCFLFGFVPSLLLYLVKLGDFFNGDKATTQNLPTPKMAVIRMMLISTLSFPINFYWYGFRAKKITWLIAGLVYSIPLATLIILSTNGAAPSSHQFQFAILSQMLMWIASLVHTNRIKIEYFTRTRAIVNAGEKTKTQQAKDQEQEQPFKPQDRNTTEDRDIDWKSRYPFVILGIPSSATEIEIKQAYYHLIAQYHPDKFATRAPEFRKLADEKSKIINWAYSECLKVRAA